MSNPEEPTQSLLRASSQQTDIDAEATGQRSRPSRAYKVAGLTVLACVLIVGQVAIAYFLLSEKSDIKSLQEQTDKMRLEMTKPRSVSVPIRMQMPMNTLAEFAVEGSSGGTQQTQPAAETICQQEASGKKPVQVPGFSPDCDRFGLYLPQQCHGNECWCVQPRTGEQIPGSLTNGPATCGSTGARGAMSARGAVLQLPDFGDIDV